MKHRNDVFLGIQQIKHGELKTCWKKSEVLRIFKTFKALDEKQSNKHIKVLRTYQGKEYNLHEFDKLSKDKVIERQLTITYSSHTKITCPKGKTA
ncbi:hypothetical protein CR513_33562, partial [Mucuna pruriens]